LYTFLFKLDAIVDDLSAIRTPSYSVMSDLILQSGDFFIC
jgi:hypothetical protein